MSAQSATVVAIQRLVEQLRPDAPPGAQLSRETRFVADLGLASLELIGLVFLCEQTFCVSLISQPGLLATLHTVGQTVDALLELQGIANGEPARDGSVAASDSTAAN